MNTNTFLRLFAAVVVGVVVGFVLTAFAAFSVVNPAPEPASRWTVIEQAVAEGGYVWPGTEIEIEERSPDEIVIQRRWLGLTEKRSVIGKVGEQWQLGGTPEDGPGQDLQMLLGVAMPTLLVFLLIFRVTKPRVGS